MFIGRILAGVAIVGSFIGAYALDLQDTFNITEFRLPLDKRLRVESAAPLIVLGQVLEFSDIGPPQRSPGDARIRTQLTRLKIHVEVPIKGGAVTDPLVFYYFTYSSKNNTSLGVPVYIPHVGQRRIYFLRRWEDTYRSVGDVTDYTLPVDSGVHKGYFCRGKQPGCCIAELRLRPGESMDDLRFMAGLYSAAYDAKVLCGAATARDLLRQLTEGPATPISDRAREVRAMIGGPMPALR
jgi:hypothetical protein